MNARIFAVLAAALFLAPSFSGCSSAEPVEETADQQEAVGVRPVNELGQPLNPVTLQPMDDYPLGYCTYVCSLSKRWVLMANSCKGVGVPDDQLANQECTQERTRAVIGDSTCPKEVMRSCVNPRISAP